MRRATEPGDPHDGATAGGAYFKPRSCNASWTIWLVKPHSLSYQHITFARSPPTTRVMSSWTTDARGSPHDVAGDKRIFGNSEDLPVAFGRGFLAKGSVDLFSGSLPTEQEHEVRDRTDRDGAAHRDAVEAPSHLRERLGRGDRCSGAGRNEVRGGSPPAAEVFLAAGAVHDRLGGCVGVHRGEERLLDTEVAVQDF